MKVDATSETVIIGGGAAGLMCAAMLAEAGREVTVLEAGPAWTLPDLYSSQLWSRRLKWGGAPIDRTGQHPYSHNLNMGSGLGGAALHHYATWPRFIPETFELHARYGRGLDWSISYEALRPHYDRIQEDIGISGDASAEPWRPPGAPYPMPPLQVLKQGRLLAAGFDGIGLPTAPLPLAINSRPYKGRPACIYDGWCDAGCPTGALANPLVTHLPRARAAGADIRTQCGVSRIRVDAQGRARIVEFHERGELKRMQADVLILAAAPVENARILLNSADGRFPQGLANGSGQVGRHLMIECIAFAYGMFEEETEPHTGLSAGQLIYQEGYVDGRRPGIFGAYHWQIAPAMKPNDIFGIASSRPEIFGQDLHAFLRASTRHIAAMVAFGGGPPEPQNRILLSAQRDRFGVPLARIEHTFSEGTLDLWEFLKDEGQRVFKAAGATEAWPGPLVTGHLTGGTVMGSDPVKSVTDGFGRCHEVPNMIITGSGLFPQTGGANPTYTLYAVTQRSMEQLLAHWSDYAA